MPLYIFSENVHSLTTKLACFDRFVARRCIEASASLLSALHHTDLALLHNKYDLNKEQRTKTYSYIKIIISTCVNCRCNRQLHYVSSISSPIWVVMGCECMQLSYTCWAHPGTSNHSSHYRCMQWMELELEYFTRPFVRIAGHYCQIAKVVITLAHTVHYTMIWWTSEHTERVRYLWPITRRVSVIEKCTAPASFYFPIAILWFSTTDSLSCYWYIYTLIAQCSNRDDRRSVWNGRESATISCDQCGAATDSTGLDTNSSHAARLEILRSSWRQRCKRFETYVHISDMTKVRVHCQVHVHWDRGQKQGECADRPKYN